jgi:hypothetical protein
MPGHIAGAGDLGNNDPSCEAAKHVWAVLGSARAGELGCGEMAMGGLGKRLYAACGNATYLAGRCARELSASRTKSHILCASRMSRKHKIEFHRIVLASMRAARPIRRRGPAAVRRMKAFREAAEIYRIATLARCG